MKLETLLLRDRVIRVVGFDDAPFKPRKGGSASIVGVVCAGTRFEGMVWGAPRSDGSGASTPN